jgi:NAD(P)H dehydrogenase (quinone)
MNVLVVVAHPNVQSFNRAIAESTVLTLQRNGHNVQFHDLYEERFDPILQDEEIARDAFLQTAIERHCSEVASAEGFVIVHPNWWGQPPAILKGWIDRVFRPGVAYEFQEGDSGEGVPIGLLRANAAIVFNTSNTPKEREEGAFGDPLETLWKNCIFDLCGVKNFYRKMFGIIVTSTPEQRKEWLNVVGETINMYFPAVLSSKQK